MPDAPFDPGPPREPIAHPDIDEADVAEIIDYLAAAGAEATDG